MIQRQQMLAPLGVDGLQQDLLFDVAHRIAAEGFQLFGHHRVRSLADPLFDHVLINALFCGPINDGQIQRQAFDQGGLQPLTVPLIGIGFRRHIGIDQIGNNLMAHILHDFRQVFALHDFQTLAKDRLALVIHHIVEFQQLLADVEVAAFDLCLRLFKALVDPRVNDGLAFLHPQFRQNRIKPLRAENPHQIVFKAEEEA